MMGSLEIVSPFLIVVHYLNAQDKKSSPSLDTDIQLSMGSDFFPIVPNPTLNDTLRTPCFGPFLEEKCANVDTYRPLVEKSNKK